MIGLDLFYELEEREIVFIDKDHSIEFIPNVLKLKRDELIEQWKMIKNLIFKTKDSRSNLDDKARHNAAWFGLTDYTYNTGKGYYTHKSKEVPASIKELAGIVERELGVDEGYYNCVLINWYGKGEGIGRHQDKELALRSSNGEVGSIATLSLGGSSKITISGNGIQSVNIEAKHNSLYQMPKGRFQELYYHQVGKSKKNRISLTFRHLSG